MIYVVMGIAFIIWMVLKAHHKEIISNSQNIHRITGCDTIKK